MKRLLMTMLIAVVGAGLYAQNILFPAKVGMTLTYAENDAKGNAQLYTVLTIKDVKGSGKNMTITYGIALQDKNRKLINGSETTCVVVIKDGVVIMDINQMIPAQVKQQGVKMDVTGSTLELPDTLQPNQALKPYELTMTMDLGIMKTNTVVKSEGKCLAIEDVKVPAGTFKSYKITQKMTSSTMNITNVETVISWYAPNVGTVKSETYNDKNQLTSSTVLVELKG